jgi:hypothetical protein
MPESPLPPPAARTRIEQAVRVFASLALLALVGTYVAAQVDFVRRHHPGVDPTRYWLPQLSQIWVPGLAGAAVLAVVAFVLERYARRK